MKYQNVLQMAAFSPDKMKKMGLFDTRHLFCDIYCFEPGQVQKPHAHHESDKVYYVLQGKGMFKIGEEEKELSEHHITLAPAGVEHGVTNHGNQRLVLLVLMAPNPNVPHSH
jgi:mannose-6-phosphate isomerase-like protein (cupin superfamily)